MYKDIERHSVTQEEYFRMDGISNSDIGLYLTSPKMYRAKINGLYPEKKNDAMLIGSAFDTMLLEPECFDERYALVPDVPAPTTDMQKALAAAMSSGLGMDEAFAEAGYKSANKATWESLIPYVRFMKGLGGREAITAQQYENMEAMKRSTLLNKHAAAAIAAGEKQVVFTARHIETGLLVKGMLDILTRDAVVDLKTTGESVGRFTHKIFQRAYDRQMGHYTALAGVDCGRFIAVERDGYNECDCFELSDEVLVRGREKMHQALIALARSAKDNFQFRDSHYAGGWVIV